MLRDGMMLDNLGPAVVQDHGHKQSNMRQWVRFRVVVGHGCEGTPLEGGGACNGAGLGPMPRYGPVRLLA